MSLLVQLPIDGVQLRYMVSLELRQYIGLFSLNELVDRQVELVNEVVDLQDELLVATKPKVGHRTLLLMYVIGLGLECPNILQALMESA
jgi:hypothetical protein